MGTLNVAWLLVPGVLVGSTGIFTHNHFKGLQRMVRKLENIK